MKIIEFTLDNEIDDRRMVYRMMAEKFPEDESADLDGRPSSERISTEEVADLAVWALESGHPNRGNIFKVLAGIVGTSGADFTAETICTEPTTLVECENCCELAYDECTDRCSDAASGLDRYRPHTQIPVGAARPGKARTLEGPGLTNYRRLEPTAQRLAQVTLLEAES